MHRWPALALAALAGCASASPNPAESVTASTVASSTAASVAEASPASREPGADLAMLVRTLEGTHPDPYHAVGRDELVAALDAYEAALPTLEPAQAAVELMRIWAMVGRERDGHQLAIPASPEDDLMLPLRLYEFEGEPFVTDAREPYEDLVGARITGIGGMPAADVLAAVEPLLPRDGPTTVASLRPLLVLRTVVLEGLGIVERRDEVELTVEDPDGAERSVVVEAIGAEEHEAWSGPWVGPFGPHRLPSRPDLRYLAGKDPFDMVRLDGGETLYLRYRFVAAPDLAGAREQVADGGVDRLVLDLRQNMGGNFNTYAPLLALVEEFAGLHPGATTVLIDRVTFSAASMLVTELEQSTDAVFIGESTGGAPNFWADVRWLELPALPIAMRVAISSVHHELAAPDDPRLAIQPDIAVAVTAADWLAGRDPVLEAALAH